MSAQESETRDIVLEEAALHEVYEGRGGISWRTSQFRHDGAEGRS
jgi:hypothetical protein